MTFADFGCGHISSWVVFETQGMFNHWCLGKSLFPAFPSFTISWFPLHKLEGLWVNGVKCLFWDFDVYSAKGELYSLQHEQEQGLSHWACLQPEGCSCHPHMSLEMIPLTDWTCDNSAWLGQAKDRKVANPGFGLSDLQGTKTWERNGRNQGQRRLHSKTL